MNDFGFFLFFDFFQLFEFFVIFAKVWLIKIRTNAKPWNKIKSCKIGKMENLANFEYKELKRNHFYFLWLCLISSIGGSVIRIIKLEMDGESYTPIGGLITIIILFVLLFVSQKYENKKNCKYFGMILQIFMNTASLYFSLDLSPQLCGLGFIFIFNITLMSFLLLHRNFIINILVHFSFIMLAIYLHFSYHDSYFYEAISVVIMASVFIFFCIKIVVRKIRENIVLQDHKRKTEQELLLDFFPEIIFLYSKEKGIVYANELAKKIVEQNSQPNLISTMQNLVAVDHTDATLFDEIEKFASDQQIIQPYLIKKFCFKMNKRSFSSFTGSAHLSIFEAKLLNCSNLFEKGTILVFLDDITKRLELEQASMLSKNKNILLCSVSHEIRTPLNHIFGNITHFID
jgi:hypothetical protein